MLERKKLTTLSGYIHFLLTGRHVLGIGEASGMFPGELTCGKEAGRLTKDGALLLDPSGELESGIVFSPPEEDAATGMTATDSVRIRSENVSMLTSDYAMVVVENPLSLHREIGMVTPPDGSPVRMVHCNNCTSDINAWMKLFREFAEAINESISDERLYTLLFKKALEGDRDCGGLLNYNNFSGEEVTNLNAGCPVFMRESPMLIPRFPISYAPTFSLPS